MKHFLFILLIFSASKIWSAPLPESLFKAIAEIENVNSMRESLAITIPENEKANLETFKSVCKPVGMRLQSLNKENQWSIRQASDKFRNPQHKAQGIEIKAINMFKKDKSLVSFISDSQEKDKIGFYYFRRINVQTSCLKCHGMKNKRPDFVIQKYPNDKAFGFSVGDLRGIYSFFVEVKK
ncbi:MAG: DUF3365 domain-containing protein [Bdellovibrionales bacterium]|nr:DUF3365 domain-containing protein [Bdellovibrionales bacterium]